KLFREALIKVTAFKSLGWQGCLKEFWIVLMKFYSTWNKASLMKSVFPKSHVPKTVIPNTHRGNWAFSRNRKIH
ncbi:uncharacterized protein METZ01_LOCUS473425, partial [marine metagenome]